MDHRAAQILGAGLATGVPPGHVVGHAIVADQLGVIDRKVGGALLEIADRIAARLHHLGEEFVGPPDRRAWVVDELALHLDPAVGEPRDLVAAERANVQRLDALLALAQLGLGLAGAAGLVHRGDVFGAVLRTHLLGPAPLRVDDRAGDKQHHNDGQSDCEIGVHGSVLRAQATAPQAPAASQRTALREVPPRRGGQKDVMAELAEGGPGHRSEADTEGNSPVRWKRRQRARTEPLSATSANDRDSTRLASTGPGRVTSGATAKPTRWK